MQRNRIFEFLLVLLQHDLSLLRFLSRMSIFVHLIRETCSFFRAGSKFRHLRNEIRIRMKEMKSETHFTSEIFESLRLIFDRLFGCAE